MSSEREVIHRWTCDTCGHIEAVGDDGSGYPRGWQQVAHTAIAAQLGNVAAQHLCGNCSTSLHLLLTNNLGDAGDMADAWDEGHRDVCNDCNCPLSNNPHRTTEASR